MLLGQKEVVLFLEIDRGKNFLSLIHPHSQMCIRIHILNVKKQTSKKNKTKQEHKKAKKMKKKTEYL